MVTDEIKEITLEFTYEYHDVLSALRLHYKKLVNYRFDYSVSIIVLLVGILSSFYRGFNIYNGVFICLPLILITMLLGSYFIIPFYYYNSNPKFKDKYLLKFNGEGITFITDKINSRLEWTLYEKYLENAETFLLYYGKNFSIIPKRFFKNNEEIENFAEMLKKHIHS